MPAQALLQPGNTAMSRSDSVNLKTAFWNNEKVRSVFYQVLFLGLIGLAGYYLFSNTLENLSSQSIATGFGFLEEPAEFDIGESLIPFSGADTYARALLVGFINTLKVGLIGTVLALIVGTIVGIGRVSKNWLISRMTLVFIEFMQNVPTLLHLFFWYVIFYQNLPSPKNALKLSEGFYLCKRGLYFPIPENNIAYYYIFISFIVACILIFFIRRWAKKRQEATGRPFPVLLVSMAVLLGLPLSAWFAAGAPSAMSVPELKGFNFQGGYSLSAEFIALELGLVLYTSAFIAEAVRAGIQSVSRGQVEAAMAIGLRPFQALRLVVLPQALRVTIPPLTSQMLNLTKNSSIAVGIGYPDFVAVASTTINQTGQAVEGIALILIVYLAFSLSTSAFMNWYNRKTALMQR